MEFLLFTSMIIFFCTLRNHLIFFKLDPWLLLLFPPPTCVHVQASISLMPRVIDPLVIGKVIWDVVDAFVPMIDMSVTYAGKDIITGCDLNPPIIADPPTIQISGKHNELFTLVMVDPDSPSPCDFKMREFVHWIVINIPGGSGAVKGMEMVPYLAPKPEVGIHRFVYVLFQQKGPLHSICELDSRANFKTREFSMVNDLGPPVAAAFFNSRKEVSCNLKAKPIR